MADARAGRGGGQSIGGPAPRTASYSPRVIARICAVLLVVLAASAAAACGGSEPTQAEFEAQVRDSRDRTDAALENIGTAETFDQLLLRIRAASDQTRAAADDLDELGAPGDFDDEADELVTALRGLADELAATADAIEDDPTFDEQRITGLEFRFWTQTQTALTSLREQGVEVPPLAQHALPEQS